MELLVRIESIIYQKDNFYVLNTDQGKAKGYIFDNGEADIRGMKYLLTIYPLHVNNKNILLELIL